MRSFHNFLRIIIIFAIFGILAWSRPVEEGATSLEQRFPSGETTTPPDDMAFPEALMAMKDTVNRVSAANGQGSVLDGATLDDLQRLLDIIANHVERMREATQGGGTNGTTGGNPNTHPSPDAGDAGDAPAKVHNKKPHPMAIPPGAVIVNPGSMSGDEDGHSNGGSPKGELQVTSDEHGFTNITCKGISVCNPVTVISTKDGKKIKLMDDKLEKADRKKNKKNKNKFKGGWMWGKDKDV